MDETQSFREMLSFKPLIIKKIKVVTMPGLYPDYATFNLSSSRPLHHDHDQAPTELEQEKLQQR